MAYSKKLADKIRKALAHLPEVEEKKMFGGLAFMVNGKNVPDSKRGPNDVPY